MGSLWPWAPVLARQLSRSGTSVVIVTADIIRGPNL